LQAFARSDRAKQDAVLSARLIRLLNHAKRYAPFWSERLSRWLPEERFLSAVQRNLPVLSRDDLQLQFDNLRADFPQRKTMNVFRTSSSGSTGTPVRVEHLVELHQPLQFAARLLERSWHSIDLRKPIGQLSAKVKDKDHCSLGLPFRWFCAQPNAFSRCTKSREYGELYNYCVSRNPSYLVSVPLTLTALARHAIKNGRRDLRPEIVLSYASVITDEARETVREGLGAKIVENYSSEETGLIAAQCPKHDHLHVLSPATLVEIVDENNEPCSVEQPGRVLVTSMQSYGMPLIRYDIGDIAEWGAPCDCGITLPVIKKIWGRTRHMITHPDGHTTYARLFTTNDFEDSWNLKEYRFVLHQGSIVAAQLRVAERSTELARHITELVQRKLGYPYQVRVQFVDKIDWGLSWKRENFSVSDSPPPQQK
jgi:phenylacetate-CoA ligase